ncbi:MAG: hypothetical protein R3E79_46810 [Caldilineaceae bacterium]
MYNSWTETRAQMDQGLEAGRTMNRPRRQHQRWQQVIGHYRRLQQALLAPLRRTPTTPLIVQPGDAYFLAAGTHRLRMLNGLNSGFPKWASTVPATASISRSMGKG